MKFYLIFPTIFILMSLSCGGPGERIKEIDSQKATPAPTPGEREISGQFNVSGSAANDIDEYNGLLTITPQGDVYSFRWSLNRGNRAGTGVQIGNSTAASFAAIGGGKGCGVVLFKIASDGSLDGRRVMWGEEKFLTEKAARVEGRGFVGKYTSTITEADGRSYSATLSIKKDGSGYDLEWISDDVSSPIRKRLVAFGIWKGSVAAASFGGRQCGFALYDIQSNGNLEGNWGGQRTVTFGTESAKRQ